MIVLVIDANILFSALIKNSMTAKIIFEDDIVLFAPEFIFDEFLKYEALILSKTKRTKEDFIQIKQLIKEIITIVPKEEYLQYIDEAEKFSPDKNYAMYLALAVKLRCGVWSNDKKLKMQDGVIIYSTEDLIKE